MTDSLLYPQSICKLLGLMVSCGYMTLTQTSVIVKEEHVDFISSFCAELGILTGSAVWKPTYPILMRVFWRTSSKFPIDAQMLYWSKESHTKHIPREVFTLPEKNRQLFLEGFILGNAVDVDNENVLRITSPRLAKDMGVFLDMLEVDYRRSKKKNIDLLILKRDLTPIEKKVTIALFAIKKI